MQVAKEIQEAARAVHEENRVLKAELQKLREEREVAAQSRYRTEISPDLPLGPVENGDHSSATLPRINVPHIGRQTQAPRQSPISIELPTTPVGDASSKKQNIITQSTAQSILPSPSTTALLAPQLNITTSCQNTGCDIMDYSSIECSKMSPQQLTDIQEAPTLSEELNMASDRSSCAFAVSVLTSMRADITAEDVEAELGCQTDFDKCTIDNSKLFGAVDRYS